MAVEDEPKKASRQKGISVDSAINRMFDAWAEQINQGKIPGTIIGHVHPDGNTITEEVSYYERTSDWWNNETTETRTIKIDQST